MKLFEMSVVGITIFDLAVVSFSQFSDLDKYSDISESRSSLFERMNSAKKTARKGLSRLRRAISLERVDNSDDEGQMKKSSSIRSLKDKLPFRRKSTDSSGEKQRPNNATTR